MADLDELLAAQASAPVTVPKSTLDKIDNIDALLSAQAKASAPDTTPAAVSVGQAVNANLNSIPRQLGLTARYGLEGLANTAQVVTEPLRYFTDKLLPNRQQTLSGLVTGAPIPPKSTPLGVQATKLADYLGLPTPQTANERVIGDATRLVAGAGGLGTAAGLASNAPGLTGAIMSGLAANPTSQLTSAAGAGLLGGASREAGGNPLVQAGASFIGGLAGGLAPTVADAAYNGVRRLVTPAMTPQQMDIKLSSILSQAGQDYSQLPQNVQNSLRAEMASALQSGKEIDPAAVSRLAAFKSVGATPTRGMISQDPVQITREQNLSKIAANSGASDLYALPRLQNQNNSSLIGALNNLGAGTEAAPIAGGRTVLDAINSRAASLRGAEQSAWDAAKSSPGYTQPIYPDGLNAALRSTEAEGLTGFLPKQITDYMGAFQTGQQPFTPQAYKNLRSMLSAEQAKGGNEAAAATAAIRGLDSMPISPITQTGRDLGSAPVTSAMADALRAKDAQAGGAIDLVNQARGATKAAYSYESSNPLVRTALAGARTSDPEKIANNFILNGTVNDAKNVADAVGPQGVGQIRDVLATYIKKQALSGASDETGKISQSQLNAVLNRIGDEKLRIFFSPQEVQQLRDTGRVASLMQSQPIGSAVNNSNSGALVLGRGADLLGQWAAKIPLGKQIVSDPLRNINISLTQRGAQNVVPGLLIDQPKPPLAPSLLLPAAAVGGGLLAP